MIAKCQVPNSIIKMHFYTQDVQGLYIWRYLYPNKVNETLAPVFLIYTMHVSTGLQILKKQSGTEADVAECHLVLPLRKDLPCRCVVGFASPLLTPSPPHLLS